MSIRFFYALALVAGIVVLQLALPEPKEVKLSENREPQGSNGSTLDTGVKDQNLSMPSMDPARGRTLFASKGCVVCHSVNGVGGEDAPALDATVMEQPINPFEFAARMWRGAEAMIYLQREELGEQIELTGDEFSDIAAFTHNLKEQRKFSADDIPPRIKKLMTHVD